MPLQSLRIERRHDETVSEMRRYRKHQLRNKAAAMDSPIALGNPSASEHNVTISSALSIAGISSRLPVQITCGAIPRRSARTFNSPVRLLEPPPMHRKRAFAPVFRNSSAAFRKVVWPFTGSMRAGSPITISSGCKPNSARTRSRADGSGRNRSVSNPFRSHGSYLRNPLTQPGGLSSR